LQSPSAPKLQLEEKEDEEDENELRVIESGFKFLTVSSQRLRFLPAVILATNEAEKKQTRRRIKR